MNWRAHGWYKRKAGTELQQIIVSKRNTGTSILDLLVFLVKSLDFLILA